jgi:hypothetical protein
LALGMIEAPAHDIGVWRAAELFCARSLATVSLEMGFECRNDVGLHSFPEAAAVPSHIDCLLSQCRRTEISRADNWLRVSIGIDLLYIII